MKNKELNKPMRFEAQGVVLNRSDLSNFNADFFGMPRSDYNGTLYISDTSVKYSARKYYDKTGHKIFAFKSLFEDPKTGALKPREAEDRYKYLFDYEGNVKDLSTRKIFDNLWTCFDVRQYGVLFPVASRSINVEGVAQLTRGVNIYDGAQIITSQILSPFASKEGKETTTLGVENYTNSAYYATSFRVTPQNLKMYKDVFEKFQGYTLEDYKDFKDSMVMSVASHNSRTKTGASTEFALFIEYEDDVYFQAPNISELISFRKDDEDPRIGIVNIDKLADLEEIQKVIRNIEIYHNPSGIRVEKETLKKLNIGNKISCRSIYSRLEIPEGEANERPEI